MGRFTINTYDTEWNLYYRNVITDFKELKEHYPFSCLTIPPTVQPELATIRVVAANRELIEMTGAEEADFTGAYTRELRLIVPHSYRQKGCEVFGADWVDLNRFEHKDIHFFHDNGNPIRTRFGLHICVGTPESFLLMKNVILENVRTAENMLIAYERVMAGNSERLELIAYAHGEKGRIQFQQNRARYIPRR